MVWYYRLDKQEKVNTVTDIPQEQWEIKQVLPYRREAVDVKSKAGLKILKSEVVDRYYVAPEPVKTLDEEKEIKIADIKRTYQEITTEGFVCSNGIKLDCRESDKVNWMNLKLSLQPSNVIRDFDNNTHTLTDVELGEMLTELEQHYIDLIATKWTYEDLVKNYTTVDEVKAFYWRKANIDETTMEFIDYTYWVI